MTPMKLKSRTMIGKALASGLISAAGLAAGPAGAALVFPINATGNDAAATDLGGDGDVINTITGVGLTTPVTDEASAAAAFHSGIFVTGVSHWVAAERNFGVSTDFFDPTIEPAQEDPAITFDLGGIQTVGSGYIWGYTGGGFYAGGNSPSSATFEFFVGGVSQGSTSVAIPTIGNANAVGDVPSSLIGFGQAYNADTIVMTITGNHGGSTNLNPLTDPAPVGAETSGGDRVGFAEIVFSDQVASNIAPVVGDTDADGDVDDFDLIAAITNYSGSLEPRTGGKALSMGDTDIDKDVDDFDLINMITGYTGSLSTVSVPEPAGLALLGIGGLALLRRR